MNEKVLEIMESTDRAKRMHIHAERVAILERKIEQGVHEFDTRYFLARGATTVENRTKTKTKEAKTNT